MRPALVAAILLVGLMSMLDSAFPNTFLDTLCENPAPCEIRDDEGWVKYGDDSCVKAFNTPSTFNASEEACKSLSGHLVAIHSRADLDKVVCSMYRVTPNRPPYWIGLYLSFRYEDNLVFDWTDETLLNFQSFAYGQPNFLNEQEYCVETNYNCWGCWNDVPCGLYRPYVCQVKAQ